MSSGTGNNLQSVWGSSSSVVFTVGLAGISGTILQYLGYYSTTGWDAVTGLGTPNVSNLLAITPVVTPTIGYSPASLTFTATQGGANPANQTLNIQNTGGGTLSWSIGDNAAWLGLNPTSGSSTGQQNPATASVNISGMTAGTYNATITITASGATNTPRTVPVTLTINPPSTIGYSPASLTFTATQGGANPANQTLNIQNTGGGTLSWSIGDNASWLGLSPTSGSSTGLQNPVTVSVNISGMTAGTYNATITITASGATNTPRTVPVTLTISPLSPTIGYSPASLTFTATQGGANPANQTLNIQNTGGGTLSWSLSGNPSWLGLSPTSGSSTGQQNPVTVSVNISGMTAGTYNATITITASGATNTPRTVPVTLTINPIATGKMHVKSIGMALSLFSGFTRASATITIVDSSGNPVSGATVSGHWSGISSGTVSGITNTNGRITLSSGYIYNPPLGSIFTFTVDNVSLTGWSYYQAANLETSHSITVT